MSSATGNSASQRIDQLYFAVYKGRIHRGFCALLPPFVPVSNQVSAWRNIWWSVAKLIDSISVEPFSSLYDPMIPSRGSTSYIDVLIIVRNTPLLGPFKYLLAIETHLAISSHSSLKEREEKKTQPLYLSMMLAHSWVMVGLVRSTHRLRCSLIHAAIINPWASWITRVVTPAATSWT